LSSEPDQGEANWECADGSPQCGYIPREEATSEPDQGEAKWECADGSPQCGYIPREEATSATLSLDALLVSLVIDALEGRDVAIFDVPGAYLWADMPEEKEAILKLEGDFVDIMCDVNPEHIPNVRYENGKKVLYLQILKTLYGCIESALLWYELFANTLKDMGFEINPYDKCVANKMINGK